MRTMAAVFYAPRQPIRVEEVNLSDPKSGEVLVRVAATGACHSDYHAVDGHTKAAAVPLVMGHEAAGVVEKVGPNVTAFKAGDNVVFAIRPMCGKCKYCSTNRPNLCNGIKAKPGFMVDGTQRFSKADGTPLFHGLATFSQYTVVPEWTLVKVRDDVPIEKLASIGCAVVTGVGAVVNTAEVKPGSTVAVYGCGGVGLNVIQGAVIAGASRIIAVDIAASKFKFAKMFGATDTVLASETDPVKAIVDMTDGGVDYAFEVIGKPATVRQAFESVCAGGTACMVGVPPTDGEVTIPMRPLFLDRKLIGSSAGTGRPRHDFPWFIELYLQGRLKLDELQTRFRPLTEINEAFQDMLSGTVARTIIKP
ncbi:MAG: Zn-dependent alcohol dehydrogenase [SAR202 cluster bacterium]|nr:Zn-dependent alcohol dehydrogenase [SAR202 cluster bacterium]